MKAYKTSRDYKRLKELLDKGYVIVGFTTYDFNKWRVGKEQYEPMMTTDVCEAKLAGKGTNYERYCFGVRGVSFGEYWPECKIPFEIWCAKALDFEFIEPTED